MNEIVLIIVSIVLNSLWEIFAAPYVKQLRYRRKFTLPTSVRRAHRRASRKPLQRE